MRRILIVGGAGFLGAHLARRMVAEGADVHILMRPTSDAGRLQDILDSISLHRLLLTDRPAVQACLAEARPSHIFYLAANTASRHDGAMAQALESVEDVAALLCFLDAVAQMASPPRQMLRTGSIAEYGAGPLPFREVQRESPVTGYAAAIVAGTHYCQSLAPRLPFPLITVRLSLIYGAGQAEDFLVPALISACVHKRPLTLERPLDRRDILHVADAVDALCRLADTQLAGGEVVNIGSGAQIGVGELADTIAALARADHALIHRKTQADPVTLQLCVEKLHRCTEWSPRIGLGEGLAALVSDARRAVMAAAA